MKEEILRKYVKESGIDVPDDLVAAEVEQMTLEYVHKNHYETMMTGGVFMPSEAEAETAKEKIRREARRQVKTRLVLEDIIQKENFEVTQEELEEEAKAVAARQQMTVGEIKGFFGEDLSMLKDDVLFRKAIDFITG